MARGIVLGQVFDSDGSPLNAGQANLLNIKSANNQFITFNPVKIENKKMLVAQRVLNSAGVFALPFGWDPALDFGRAVEKDTLDVKILVWGRDGNTYNTYWGKAALVPDALELISNIKKGMLVFSGDMDELWKKLKPEMKNAITGKEFQSPLTMFSTEQSAIVGLMPGLRFV